MSTASYTQEQILHQLDLCAADFTCPILDNGYVYLGAVRLSAYRTDEYWALIVEQLGSDYRAGGVFNCLYSYGNCLLYTPGLTNDAILAVLDDPANDVIFSEEDRWDVVQDKGLVKVRGEWVPYNVTEENLSEKGIGEETRDMDTVTITELLRSLLPEYQSLLFATDEELKQRLPFDLPLVLRLNEWRHPDIIEEEIPSQTQAFQVIADVLVSGDASLYQPTLPPNTHWSNWLESGTL